MTTDAVNLTDTTGVPPSAPSLSGKARVVLLLISLLFVVAAAEVASRLYWRLSFAVPFRDPGALLYAFYPELKRVDRERPSHEDEYFDVLLLGGSVLHNDYAPVAQDLREQLTYQGYRNVRVYNLAGIAHSSRDSRIKYAAVAGAAFELVVFYHGINDARANSAPPDVFREDYSHYQWYETVNTLAPYHRRARLALPYTMRRIALAFRQSAGNARYVPTGRPRPEWVSYGKDIRSAAAFKGNLTAILDLAKARGDRVVLMTFATHLPQNYSFEAFKQKQLDYVMHDAAIELWGTRENVLAAIAAHNEVATSLAAERGLLLVDQARLMPQERRYFNDVCHFSVAGSHRFVENLATSVRQADRPPEATSNAKQSGRE